MSDDLRAAVDRALADIGVPHERTADGRWGVVVPATARREVTVGLAAGERTLRFNVFLMRAPDRAHEAVYRRLLHKNVDLTATGPWRFGLDEHGDVHLAAEVPLATVDTPTLDGLLGTLSALVDATFTGLVTTGFTPTDAAP